jgi:phospholipid/cholesterol/gamma-HCH transport system permease protein
VSQLLALPRQWFSASGELIDFAAHTIRDVWTLGVLRFTGETVRQAGLLIVSSSLVIWALVFIVGIGTCGTEGAYFTQAQGASTYAGVFTAWCDLREAVPYAFGYMMAAKVGTGIVAEIGAMRISDEIDALEVMGIDSMCFLCATRLLASWLVFPFIYAVGIGVAYLASYIAVIDQVHSVSAGGYLLVFWQFQNPLDFIYSLTKAMMMTTVVVIVGCYYGYTASGGPVGVGTATAKSMVVNIVSVNLIGMMGSQVFWGAHPNAPIGG